MGGDGGDGGDGGSTGGGGDLETITFATPPVGMPVELAFHYMEQDGQIQDIWAEYGYELTFEDATLFAAGQVQFDTISYFEDVNFSIEPGTFVTIICKSGGGKSTLLNIIRGVLDPTSGSIEFDTPTGEEVTLGHVFQRRDCCPGRRRSRTSSTSTGTTPSTTTSLAGATSTWSASPATTTSTPRCCPAARSSASASDGRSVSTPRSS